MVINMKTGSGRILDEACNHNNEVYNDEVLYTAWAEAPNIEARLLEIAASTHGESTKKDVERFMASLYAFQG